MSMHTVAATTEHMEAHREAAKVVPEAAGHSWVNIAVPSDGVPGRFVKFAGPDGMEHSALVPAGLAPGQTFVVEILHGVVLQSQLVQVPEGATAGDRVAFVGPCGQHRMARIPEGVRPLEAFPVQVPVPQPCRVVAFDNATPGDEAMFVAPDGRPRKAVVPEGVAGGQTFTALVEPVPVAPVEPLAPVDLQPWLKAAREFKMNSDFEVPGADALHKLDFGGLMTAMKKESAGKMTIQALSDKIVLSQMLDNLRMPQMPLLLALQDPEQISKEVERFVDDCSQGNAETCIIKPTHLSNAEGVMQFLYQGEEEKAKHVEYLESHLRTFMNKKAQEFESEALQSLRPGFVAQPKYESSVGFPTPLELRIVTLWGKARMGVWWWGCAPPTPYQRNAWIVRQPRVRGELHDDDSWEVVHEHQGHNPGFEKALELFLREMSQMALAAERVATAVGAPFLRVDFFVGDPKWGVRLNEVAYGSGTLHKRPSNNGGVLLVDDSHAMAQILREGMEECNAKQPAEDFLSTLGVRGSTYADLAVDRLPLDTLPPETFTVSQNVPPSRCVTDDQQKHEEDAVPPELCVTPRIHWAPHGFAPSVDAATTERAGGTGATRQSSNRLAPLLKKVQHARENEAGRKANCGATWTSMLERFASSAPSWFGIQESSHKRASQDRPKRPQRCQA